ncbi:ATP-binding protein [Paenibacillus gansuensis]|uniref:histidine kinase n=1 Tax=Paenibacillus gansuensis TaxID=306542 RepID=A0ABW5P836_9BACL
MEQLKDYLFQLMMVAVPIFVYEMVFYQKVSGRKPSKWIASLLWSSSILLCMSFPADFGSGYRLDIRVIPLLLGTLYFGLPAGIVLTVTVAAYRLYMGTGEGLYTTILTLLCTVPLFVLLGQRFAASGRIKKISIGVVLCVYYSVTGMAWSTWILGFSLERLQAQVTHLLFSSLVVWGVIVLKEKFSEFHRLRQDLQDKEKLRVLGELTSVFAHEIRNPMQVVRGFLQLLDDSELPGKKKQYIQLSIEELDRANGIINDLLAFSKPTDESRQRTDAGARILRVIEMMHSYSDRYQIAVKRDVRSEMWIHANPQKFDQCVMNILKNAIESMPDGGQVTVCCGPSKSGMVEILIKDEGVGMTKEQVDRLGSPYYSLKESGTGLGLMVSYQIIRDMKGKVQVKSEIGKGTTVSIQLPGVI